MKRQVYVAIFLVIFFVTAVIAGQTDYGAVGVGSASAEAQSGYDDLGSGGILYRSYANTLHIIWTSGFEGWLPAEYKIKISASQNSSGTDWRKITLKARGTVSGGSSTTLNTQFSTKDVSNAAAEVAGISIDETVSAEFSWDWSTNSDGEYTVTGYGGGSWNEPAFNIDAQGQVLGFGIGGGIPFSSEASGCFDETDGSTTTFTVGTDELVVSGQF